MRRWIPVLALLAALASELRADERRFTYSYEPRTLPQGTWEFEQWATLRTQKDTGSYFALDLREEIETGLLDRLTAALYLNFQYSRNENLPGLADGEEFEFRSVSTEWKYKVFDPTADPLGVLIYLELGFANDETEIEAKLVLGRDLGPFTLAYNFIFEVEWEKRTQVSGGVLEEDWERLFLVQHTVGLSWKPLPSFAVGLEAVYETQFGDTLDDDQFDAFYWGPNVHVALGGWWATLTFLKQTDVFDDAGLELQRRERYQLRLIVGVNF